MKKLLVYTGIVLGLLGCEKYPVNNPPEILDKPVTLITKAPNRIDSSYFEQLLYTFGELDTTGYAYPEEIDSETYDTLFRQANRIAEVPDYYGGLTPAYKMVLIYSAYTGGECLYIRGGIAPYCQRIILEDQGEFILLASAEDLQEYFQPISTEEEALSYVAVATDTELRYDFDWAADYNFYVDKVNKSYAQETGDGFTTMSFYYCLYGCGPHSQYALEHFTDYEGNITEVVHT
jgi:hypothetical protein